MLLFCAEVSAQTTISSLTAITSQNGNYIIIDNIDASDFTSSITNFTGALTAQAKSDGSFPVISNLSVPIFTTVTGATISNIILDNVGISQDGIVGAIAATANGATRIYNCGILSGSVGSTGNYTDSPKTANCCGSLVGLLNGTSRVINCFSYATITNGNRVGGIVGYNNVTSNSDGITTMVMNCMYYGDIIGGNKVSPIYGGNVINNLQDKKGLNTFNFYAYNKLKSKEIVADNNQNFYNCALAIEERFLNRFELYRLLLNSNKKLAAWYATGSVDNAGQMAKWVLETADRTISNPKPYPVLKAQGTYPSIINPDFTNAPDSITVGRNKGGKLGKTLNITISDTKTDGGQAWPSGATITKTTDVLVRTDMDGERFNFNYDKIQLPYYNDYGTGNYTEGKVVTGWKITSITGGTTGTYSAADNWGGYNFADRKCTNKDLYDAGNAGSDRVFAQGAYWDVPYGVTAITIEPYWGNAAFIADEYYDMVFTSSYGSRTGKTIKQVNNTTFNGVSVKTDINTALGTIPSPGSTVYDNAIVLVGNFHQSIIDQKEPFKSGTTPFTLMSVDLDHDHEPDYSLIFHDNKRSRVPGIRFDFLNIIGTAQAQKPNGTGTLLNTSVFNPSAWFEITNTCLIYFSQFEYENSGKTTGKSPIILLGGVFDQFTSTKSSTVNNTTYIHLGGNVWFKEFNNGTHSDGNKSTKHIPISVTGGEYDAFYLTGTYNSNAAVNNDNAECYISGGHFKELAGAGQEQIGGNVQWQIYNADIDNFFGGGINDAKPIKGTITTNIYNSHVDVFCGGPKFGNMTSGKTVTTNATGCTFNKYFGAGFGGNAISRKKYYDKDGDQDWPTLQGYYTSDRGLYYDGVTTRADADGGHPDYGKKGPGVAVDLEYEMFVWTSGKTGARLYVKFATFSLAQCENVTSNLTGCTINGNFYGGGSLGKVTGTATSVLDGCTVNGNVFGGGFSAELPDIPVRNAGFITNPKFNKYSGMFEPGIYSGTTDFEWKNATEAGITLSDGETGISGNYEIYTDQDLTTLGQVNNTILTVTGNTYVSGVIEEGGSNYTGGVFGGGDQSAVHNNTEVHINTSDQRTLLNVFGGGNNAPVGGNTSVELTGSSKVQNNVYGGGNLAGVDGSTTVNIKTGTVINDVYGGGMKGNVDGAVTVYIGKSDGSGTVSIGHDVYGGGKLAHTNMGNLNNDQSITTNINTTQVYLNPGATIGHDVYGGGRGEKPTQNNPGEAIVYGDVSVFQYGAVLVPAYDSDGLATSGRIFGCNNVNGTPKGHVLVDVEITAKYPSSTDKYDLAAVYGGGNEAEFFPYYHEQDNSETTEVVINGCNIVSIHSVYGGGNAASTPATDVKIRGAKEIEFVYGGGNGAGTINGEPNPGANVGYKYFPDNISGPDQVEQRSSYKYGSGLAVTEIYGGTIHYVYGGSNTKGNVRKTSVARLEELGDCPLQIDEIYGGGRAAFMDGSASLELGCISGLDEIYGGSERADIGKDVVLTITSGKYNKVFGGNNVSGHIFGSITVNIEQTGCLPIEIGELYGGGNLAPYSVYGYDGNDLNYELQTGSTAYADPQINIKSFKSIGTVYGGGYKAEMVGNPHININVVKGWTNGEYKGTEPEEEDDYAEYKDTPKNMPETGLIGTVFGGGNDADVVGQTFVNIGTESYVTVHDVTKDVYNIIKNGRSDISNPQFTESDNGSTTKNLTITVEGATITGNVYGGGNNANVTQGTNITIGQ